MSKVPLSAVGSLAIPASAQQEINDNFATLAAGLDNSVSRDGTAPNNMLADLDMDGHKVLNVADPVNPTDGANLRYVDSAMSRVGVGNGTFPDIYAVPYLQTTSEVLQGLPVSLHRFLDPTKLRAIRERTSTFDCTSGIQTAFNETKLRTLIVPAGVHNYAGNLTRTATGLKLWGEGGSAHATLRATAAGGLVFSGGSIAGIQNDMGKLDLEGLRLEAAVYNAGTAVTMNYTGGSGSPPAGPRFQDVWIGSKNETNATGVPSWNKGIRGTNVRDIRLQGLTIAGTMNTAAHPMNPVLTHALHFDGTDDPVEIWIDDYYAYFLQTGLLVEGQYEGVYVNRMSTVGLLNGIKWLSPSPNPTFQLYNSYLGTQELGVLLDMISYFQIGNNEFNATAPVPNANYRGVVIDRSAIPGVSNQTNMGVVSNNSFIGVGYSNSSPYTEVGIDVVSGNTLDLVDNKMFDLDIGVRVAALSVNTAIKVRNSYQNCTVNEQVPAATRTAIGGDVAMRVSGAVATFPVNTATKLIFPETEDRGGDYYNPGTGDYTPPAGTYRVSASAKFTTGIVSGDYCIVEVRKNGVTVLRWDTAASYTGACQAAGVGQVTTSGTDVLNVYVQVLGASGDRTVQNVDYQTYLNIEAAPRS